MLFNLKDIRAGKARNGYSMSATLLADGAPVCFMEDDGDGSQPKFDILNKELFADIDARINALPELFVAQYGMNMKIDLCMFIDLLHYALETKSEFTLLK